MPLFINESGKLVVVGIELNAVGMPQGELFLGIPAVRAS
jgi:hypothetical protein